MKNNLEFAMIKNEDSYARLSMVPVKVVGYSKSTLLVQSMCYSNILNFKNKTEHLYGGSP